MLAVMTPFMIVRHPFIRLVSAYEDKILNPKPGLEYHKTVQDEIKRKRRKGGEHSIVFPEYLLKTQRYQMMLRKKVRRNSTDSIYRLFLIFF